MARHIEQHRCPGARAAPSAPNASTLVAGIRHDPEAMSVLCRQELHQFALHGSIFKQSCAWYGQWIASPYMVKNHYYNSHTDLLQRLGSSVHSFLSDISLESPCAYCTSTAKAKTRHVPSAVLFQAALLLASLQNGDSTDRATATALRGSTFVDNNPSSRPAKTVQSAASQEQREGEAGRSGMQLTQHSRRTNDDKHLINLLSRLVLQHEEATPVLTKHWMGQCPKFPVCNFSSKTAFWRISESAAET